MMMDDRVQLAKGRTEGARAEGVLEGRGWFERGGRDFVDAGLSDEALALGYNGYHWKKRG